MARAVGIEQAGPTPDEQDLVGKLRDLMNGQGTAYERPALDLLAPHREEIAAWLKDDNMTAKQVWRLLKETHGITVGYSTIKRYLRSVFSFGRTKATVRIETPPGEEAQVDFGYAGLMHDSETERNRRAWAFIMTLSSSRHILAASKPPSPSSPLPSRAGK
jgi:transposase